VGVSGVVRRRHDTTVRRAWEAARKVDIHGRTVTLDPAGPLAEAAWTNNVSPAPPKPCPTATAACPSSRAAPTPTPA
jgi:hypothetical protein